MEQDTIIMLWCSWTSILILFIRVVEFPMINSTAFASSHHTFTVKHILIYHQVVLIT